MADGSFRSKCGYTVIQNIITKDRTVSLKAKGLYLTIQTYITLPGKVWYKDDFIEMVSEGAKAFDSAWNELKAKGYLKVHAYPNGGKGWKYEFELLDEPQEGPHTIYYNAKGEASNDNTKIKRGIVKVIEDKKESSEDRGDMEESPEIGSSSQYPQNGSIAEKEDSQYPHFHTIAKQSIAEHTIANGGINNKSFRLNPVDKNFLSNPSVNQSKNDDGLTDGETKAVVLDPEQELSAVYAIGLYNNVLKCNGLPNDCTTDKKTASEYMMMLSYWEDYAGDNDKLKAHAFVLVVQSLTEMILTPMGHYGNQHVKNSDVLDRVNIVCRKGKIDNCRNNMLDFIESARDALLEVIKSQKVKSIQTYTKTLVWNHFTDYEIKFESYFHRTYHGIARE